MVSGSGASASGSHSFTATLAKFHPVPTTRTLHAATVTSGGRGWRTASPFANSTVLSPLPASVYGSQRTIDDDAGIRGGVVAARQRSAIAASAGSERDHE